MLTKPLGTGAVRAPPLPGEGQRYRWRASAGRNHTVVVWLLVAPADPFFKVGCFRTNAGVVSVAGVHEGLGGEGEQ